MAKHFFLPLLCCFTSACYANDLHATKRIQAGSFPRNYFLRTLSSTQPVIWQNSIERLEREYAGTSEGAQVVLAVLRRVDSDRKMRAVARRLIRTLRHFEQADVTTYLLKSLETRDYRLAMLSLQVLSERDTGLPRSIFTTLKDRQEFQALHGFRIAVLQAAAGAEATGIEFLIDVLTEIDGQSAMFAIEHLSKVSGESFGGDITQWRRWWERVDRQSLQFDVPAGGEIDKADDFTGPDFFGIDVRAKRVVFIVDKSTSMSDPLNPEPTVTASLGRPAESRLQKAQVELASAIENLPAETRFSILAFDGTVVPWRTRLVPATRHNKLQAFRFVSSITADGHTAWYDALDAAFQLDGNLESVYFLSDGVPTVGRIVSAPEILRTIADENSFRRIAINAIGLGVNTPADRFLSALAQQNSGVYRSLGTQRVQAPAQRTPSVAKFNPQRVIPRPMPPITRVRAMSAKSADRRLKPKEAVLGVVVGGRARAYPINMLTGPSREIFNDELAGRAIAATW